jgi:hypothetical protein
MVLEADGTREMTSTVWYWQQKGQQEKGNTKNTEKPSGKYSKPVKIKDGETTMGGEMHATNGKSVL